MIASSFLRAIDAQARINPDVVAFCNSRGESITYLQLKASSDALATALLHDELLPAGAPVVVYGHKSPYMLVCFLAAVKAGHAYVPMDTAYPLGRMESILAQLGGAYVLDTVEGSTLDLPADLCAKRLDSAAIRALCAAVPAQSEVDALVGTGALDPFYILFTSGSTGAPKGVVICTECVDNFSRWMVDTFGSTEHQTYYNRAAFSFDLSMTDIGLSLPTGGTMFASEEEAEKDLGQLFASLADNDITWWVSTPSTMDMCLADPAFSAELLPHLQVCFFVGETLKPQTVRRIKERFPQARVVNGYGPTESTDLVSWCWIDDAMLASDKPLPIGVAKPGTRCLVLDSDTLAPVPTGEVGELFIIGDTVALGYYKLPEQTAAAFESLPASELAPGERSFRTGDAASQREDGMLYFHGRLDHQVKLHGYRIELGEIEANLDACPEVRQSCVVTASKDGTVSHLVAFVTLADPAMPRSFATTKELKAKLRTTMPDYMIPRSFKYLDALPLSANRKIDRKELTRQVSS